MEKLNSLSLFVGTGQCNANCKHCAGKPLRKYSPKEDGVINNGLIYKTIKDCYNQGARYLSLSSSGEPTLSPLSVTKTLRLIKECEKEGIKFSPINLYSNGIIIGQDKNFCDEYLSLWKELGLTTVYMTVHSIDEKKNALIYGIKKYPSLENIISRIHFPGLLVRGNLVLSKNAIYTSEEFISTAKYLEKIGINSLSAWSIRRADDDRVDYNLSPSEEELDKMTNWIKGDTIHKIKIRLLREKDKAVYTTGQKLTLFPNGVLSNTWCN